MQGRRPLLPGESIPVQDGMMTEYTATIPVDPSNMSLGFFLVPQIWMTPNGPQMLTEDAARASALAYEAQGYQFPRAKNPYDLDKFAQSRSHDGGVYTGSLGRDITP